MPRRQTFVVMLSLIVVLGTSPGFAGQSAAADAVPAAAPTAPAASTAAAPDATTSATPGQTAPVAVSSATAAEAKKVTCRTERVTGSNFRTRKVCTSPNAQDASGNWVRDQQDRGAIGASAIVNAGGG